MLSLIFALDGIAAAIAHANTVMYVSLILAALNEIGRTLTSILTLKPQSETYTIPARQRTPIRYDDNDG